MDIDHTFNDYAFEDNLKLKFKNYDFKFFDSYQFFESYQKINHNFFFSDLFFFNSLQVNDFMFLHRDFYQFYPVFKYMLMYDILINKLSVAEFFYIRNCIILAERVDLFSIKQDNFLQNDSLERVSLKKFTARDFDSFYSNLYSFFFEKNIVKKFFSDFLDKQIFFQQVDEDFYNFSTKFYS